MCEGTGDLWRERRSPPLPETDTGSRETRTQEDGVVKVYGSSTQQKKGEGVTGYTLKSLPLDRKKR